MSPPASPISDAALQSSQKTRLKRFNACENCRLRKIKCSGEIPCKPCSDAEIPNTCHVRPRPKPTRTRALRDAAGESDPGSAQIPEATVSPAFRFSYDNVGDAPIISAPAQDETFPPEVAWNYGATDAHSVSPVGVLTISATSVDEHDLNPLVRIEKALAEWCNSHDVPLISLLFRDQPRIALLQSTPLPSDLASFEDDLMCSLLAAEDLDHLQTLDSARLVNLYWRYRTLPLSLTEDQTALIYATLCIARYTQLRGGVAAGLKDPKGSRREDVTYYRMARAALDVWGRASINSVWALIGLVVWVQLHGSVAEHTELLAMLAWQVRTLGLHHRATALLYPPQDMCENLLAAYMHSETLRAIMTDLRPAIPIADIEIDTLAPQALGANLAKASKHAVKYLKDFADPLVDVTTAGYLAAAEEAWSSDLDQLRGHGETGLAKVKLGWAQMRLHWLRILLHAPRMWASPGRANQATIYVFRSLAHILNIHTDAASINKLDPSWPQLKRIMVCGQILILCIARGECHQAEATDLFGKLVVLLQAHVDFWPVAEDAIQGFQTAASKLGVPLPIVPNRIPAPVSDIQPFQFDADLMGAGLFLDLDLFGNTTLQ